MERVTNVMAATSAEVDVQSLANQYVVRILGENYQAVDGFLGGHHWYFRIVYHSPTLAQPLGVGKLQVEADSGVMIPLTQEQIADAHDQASEQCGGTTEIVGPTARRRIQGYLTNYGSLFAEPDRPIYLNGPSPLWRATVFLRRRGQGRLCDLGTIDVDATTGDVIPLDNQQLQGMRERVQ